MMRNSKYNLVPYEVIERAITGDTAALLAVQERHKAYIGRLSGGNADLKERLNAKPVSYTHLYRTTADLRKNRVF